jgi:hypothetical protein
LHHRTCFVRHEDQTQHLLIVVVNDEPGIMEPGHCFTIEVGSGFGLFAGYTELFDSLRLFKVQTPVDGYFQMAGRPQPKCVIFALNTHLTLIFGLELRSKCPGRAHDPHHRKWGGRAYTLMRTLLYTCTGTTFMIKTNRKNMDNDEKLKELCRAPYPFMKEIQQNLRNVH